jgi:hypothetical protein
VRANSGVRGSSQGLVGSSLAAPVLCLAFVAGCLAGIPWGAPVGGGFVIPLAALGLLALGAARFDREGRWARVTAWPVVLVLGAFAVSILRCRLPGMAIERSASMPLYAMAFLAVQVCMWDARVARALVFVIAAVALVMSVDITVQKLTGTSLVRQVRLGSARLAGSQGNPNDLAAATLLVPAGFAALSGARHAAFAQVLYAAAVAPAWIFSVSRQAFGAWAVSCVGNALSVGRSRRVAWVAVGVLVAAAIAVAAIPAARARAFETARRGLGEREAIVAFGAHLAAENPMTGIGPGLFGSYYGTAALEGWSWRGQALPKVGMPWVHCLPVEVACEYGVVGLAAFGGVAAAALRRSWHAARAGEPIGRAALLMLAGFLLIGLVDLTFIKDWVRCEAWVVAGLAFGSGPGGAERNA